MNRFLRALCATSVVTGAFGVAVACGGKIGDGSSGGVTASADAGADKKVIPLPPPDPPPIDPFDADVGVDGVESVIVASEFGSEVQMAVSKTGRIVVDWIGIGIGAAGAAIRYSISDDGGKTWTSARTVGESVGDPVVGALDDGTFILGGLRADCPTIDTCQNGELFLSRLGVGETNTIPMPSLREPPNNAFIDHPWMIVHGEDVSLIGAVFPQDDAGAYQYGMTVWRSANGGDTFDRTEVVTATAANQVGVPRFCGGDGVRTWAHFYDGTTPTFGRIRWTDALDDGWTAANTTSAGGSSATLSTTGACASHADTLYAIIGEAASGGGGADETATYNDLHLMATSDLGATWLPLGVVAVSGASYLLPEINVEPDGTIDVFYYTGTNLNGPGRAEVVRSHDGGKTFGKPIVLGPNVRFVADRGSNSWLGDYNAVNFSAGQPVFAFGDNTTSPTRIRFARVVK
jgi:hypothetical protein